MSRRGFQGRGFCRSAAKRVANAALILFLLASVFAAQIAATDHEITVQHVICAQHGDVMDVDYGDSASAYTSDATDQSQFSSSNQAPAPHHQHCAFVSARHVRSCVKEAAP